MHLLQYRGAEFLVGNARYAGKADKEVTNENEGFKIEDR